MKQTMDKIVFESRAEIREIIRMIELYMDAYPKDKNNETIKRLYSLLDTMEMGW